MERRCRGAREPQGDLAAFLRSGGITPLPEAHGLLGDLAGNQILPNRRSLYWATYRGPLKILSSLNPFARKRLLFRTPLARSVRISRRFCRGLCVC